MPETTIDIDTKRALRDAARLVDLLLMLPDLESEEDDWWERFAEAEERAHDPSRDPGGRAYYMKNHLLGYRDANSTFHAQAFAMYCLMFFDSPSPEMISLVGQRMEIHNSAARLLKTICDLAWEIYLPLKVAERRRSRDIVEDGV